MKKKLKKPVKRLKKCAREIARAVEVFPLGNNVDFGVWNRNIIREGISVSSVYGWNLPLSQICFTQFSSEPTKSMGSFF